MTVIRLKVGIVFSDTEKGTSTCAVSGGLTVAVRIKKVNRTANMSTIGVISIRGDFGAVLIFDI